MISLEDAITHCLEVTDGHTEQGKCPECAEDHRQLASWLRELKERRQPKKPSLWWKCERCGKLIPYMADFCHECADELLEETPKPYDPQERSGKE